MICARYDQLWPMYWPFLGGLVNGWLVTPDIDVDHITHEESRWAAIPVFGGLIETAFATFWYPYALNAAHRGLSHAWLFGTLTRFVYQFAGLAIALVLGRALIEYLGGSPTFQLGEYFTWAAAFSYYVGWAVQDTFHLLFDWRGLRLMVRGITWAILAGILLLTVIRFLSSP